MEDKFLNPERQIAPMQWTNPRTPFPLNDLPLLLSLTLLGPPLTACQGSGLTVWSPALSALGSRKEKGDVQ